MPRTSTGRSPTKPGVSKTKSIVKAIEVLEAFKGQGKTLSLTDITALTGLDKSSVQRCTRTLRDMGYLEQDPETRRYAMGRRVLDLSYEYLVSNPLVERAAPVLVDLRQTARERIDLSILDGHELIYVFRLQTKRESLSAALFGRRVAAFCSAGGRAMLSQMPEDEARAILMQSDLKARTPRTITDPEAIMNEVRRARTKGYAIQVEEWRPGEIAAAAAVRDAKGHPVAAVHIAGSTTEWAPEDFERRMGPLASVAASEIGHG